MKKDWIVRAFKTFWQAGLASLSVSMPTIIDLIPEGWECIKPVLISAVVGALAAGFSAVWNGVIAPMAEKYKANKVVLSESDLMPDEDKGDSETDNDTCESEE